MVWRIGRASEVDERSTTGRRRIGEAATVLALAMLLCHLAAMAGLMGAWSFAAMVTEPIAGGLDFIGNGRTANEWAIGATIWGSGLAIGLVGGVAALAGAADIRNRAGRWLFITFVLAASVGVAHWWSSSLVSYVQAA